MTDAELAILSIVAEGPIYGYDIQAVIKERGLRAWTNIGVSSMYYVLEKLERQGLLSSTGAPHTEGPARRKYRMTPAGYGVLQTSVADLLSTPREFGNGFELGLANLHVLGPTRIRAAFAAYHQELDTRLNFNHARRDELFIQNAPFNVVAMFERYIALLEAERAWLIDFIERWEAQAPPEEPEIPIEPVEIPRMKQVVLPHDADSPHRAPTRPLGSQSSRRLLNTEAETDLSISPSFAKETVMNTATPPRLTPALDDIHPEEPPSDDAEPLDDTIQHDPEEQ